MCSFFLRISQGVIFRLPMAISAYVLSGVLCNICYLKAVGVYPPHDRIELKRKGRRTEKIKQMGQSPVKKKIPSTCTAPEIEKYFRRSVAL